MLDLFLGRVKEDREDAVSSAPRMVLCAEGLLGLGPGSGSLVARWCSGLARVENNDPANDGLWTPETRKKPIDGSSNLPRATTTYLSLANSSHGREHAGRKQNP